MTVADFTELLARCGQHKKVVLITEMGQDCEGCNATIHVQGVSEVEDVREEVGRVVVYGS